MKSCSEIALAHYHAPAAELKSDHSLVTLADHAIERFLEGLFDRPEEGSYIIGEETIASRSAEYVEAALSEVAYIVDPIDGTAPYAHHIPTWGISIARMERGRITDGAVYLPITDELFITDGKDVRYGPLEGDLEIIEPQDARVPTEKRTESGMIAVTQGIVKGQGMTVRNPIQALGCAVLPLCYLLLDRYIGYVAKVKLWDVAGVLPMLEREGFTCRLMDGTAIGTKVDDSIYLFTGEENDLWKIRDRMVCAASEDIVDYIIKSIR
jgi:myo-inositol-1(or 4)-monophosphatase